MRKSGGKKAVGLVIPAIALTAASVTSMGPHELQGSLPVVKKQKRQLYKMARIPMSRAIDIALAQVGGSPISVELEIVNGFLVYEIEVRTGNRTKTRILVDAGNGDILATRSDEHDDDNDDDDDNDADDDNDDDDDNDGDNDDDDDNDGDDDLELKTGISLQKALEVALETKPGTAIEAELERENGRWIYSIEIVDADNVTYEAEVDARTGSIQKIEKD